MDHNVKKLVPIEGSYCSFSPMKLMFRLYLHCAIKRIEAGCDSCNRGIDMLISGYKESVKIKKIKKEANKQKPN